MISNDTPVNFMTKKIVYSQNIDIDTDLYNLDSSELICILKQHCSN